VEPWSNDECVVTTTFAEQGGKTLLTSTMVFPTVEDRDVMIASGMEPGAAESYDRLAEHLKTIS
jgi:uncharacterized protein YndB with AHSA1/START domain